MLYSQRVIENYIDNHNMKKIDFSEVVGICYVKLTNFLNNERHLPFEDIYLIHKTFFKKDSSFIRNTCLEYDKIKHIKPALEFLSINYHLKDLGLLLNRLRSLHGENELYKVYSFIYKYQKKEESYEKLLQEVESILRRVKSKELITLLTTIKANIHGYLREYKTLFRIAKDCEKDVEELENGIIKEFLSIRVYEILSRAYLFNQNDGETARYYADLIISKKICAKSEAYATYIIGTSYMFQDFVESFFNLSESAQKYEDLGLSEHRDIIRNHNIKLVETFWGVNISNTDGDIDASEKAFRLAKLGESEDALAILDELEDSAFRTYYRAVALNDYDLFAKALGMFMKDGDYFYATLPKIELEKNEMYRSIIQNLI